MGILSANYALTGQAREAVILREEILATSERLYGPDHSTTIEALCGLADACRFAKMFDQAILHARQALDTRKATLGPKHGLTLGAMDLLARCYLNAGRFEESIACFETIKEPQENYGAILNGYCRALQGARRLEEADCYLRKSLEVARKVSDLREREWAVATAGAILCLNLFLQGKYTEAEPVAREFLANMEKNWADHWGHYNAMSLVGGALLGQHKIAEAEQYLVQGYEGMKKRELLIYPGWEHFLVRAGEDLICYYEATNQAEKAREIREQMKLYGARTKKESPEMSSKR
jgi:tetratricopeptide (TPR) repeat protein